MLRATETRESQDFEPRFLGLKASALFTTSALQKQNIKWEMLSETHALKQAVCCIHQMLLFSFFFLLKIHSRVIFVGLFS